MCEGRPPGSGHRSPYRDASVIGQLARIAGDLEAGWERSPEAYEEMVRKLSADAKRLHRIVLSSYGMYSLVQKFCFPPLDLAAFLANGELRIDQNLIGSCRELGRTELSGGKDATATGEGAERLHVGRAAEGNRGSAATNCTPSHFSEGERKSVEASCSWESRKKRR